QLQAQKLRLAHSRGPFYSGSLPNVNQIGSGVPEFQGPSPLDSTRGTRHHGLVERVQRDPRRMMSPLRRYLQLCPWSVCVPEWAVTHISLSPSPPWQGGDCGALRGVLPPPFSPDPTSPSAGPCPGAISPWKKDIYSGCPQLSTGNGLVDSLSSLSPSQAQPFLGTPAKEVALGTPLGRSIFPSPDQPANVPLMPSALNTGGSLPDLTTLHFPSPLPTPLDPEEAPYPPLSGGSSTSNLATTMTHLGISGGG
ncbi:CRTC2 protein, partial [Erithacus rubecula]|nr:CRTC2 protein [Erithacus rubecula]